jgi:hypothetical protein
VFIDGISIGLALIEMSEEVLMRYMDGRYIRESDYKPARRWNIDHSWTTTQDVPSNRFRLVAYSPHPLVSWSTSWQETAGSTLSHQIPKILAAIKGMAAEQKERLAKAEEERARWRAEMEAEQERQARQTDLAKIRESETASVRELEEIIQAWGRRRNLDMFFDRVSEAAAELSAGELQQVSARLKLARESLGSIDPLQRFLEWKAPLERYQPRYFHLSGEHDSNSEEKADIED